MGFSEQPTGHPTLELAIKKLWSADASVRDLGRAELLLIGPAAAEPLGSLLWDLVHDHRPRFDIEREAEGRKALEESSAVLRSNDPPFDHEAFDTLSRFAINQRLICDAFALLGDLRAVEGVPILVRIMERGKPMGSEPAGLELDALSKIGSPAVPSLIKSIENARVTAIATLSEEPIGFYVLLGNSEDDSEDGEDDEWDPARDGSALAFWQHCRAWIARKTSHRHSDRGDQHGGNQETNSACAPGGEVRLLLAHRYSASLCVVHQTQFTRRAHARPGIGTNSRRQKADSPLWDRLYFRDYLRKFNDEAKRYAELKRSLAEKHPNDRAAYTEGKTEFIVALTEKAKRYFNAS